MNPYRTLACLIAAACLFASCAMSYRPVNPPALRYSQAWDSNGAYSNSFPIGLIGIRSPEFDALTLKWTGN